MICRWSIDNVIIDVMPTDEAILGFTNQWYTDLFKDPSTYQLTNECSINLAAAPYLLATKL